MGCEAFYDLCLTGPLCGKCPVFGRFPGSKKIKRKNKKNIVTKLENSNFDKTLLK